MKVPRNIQNVLTLFTTVFIHVTNARYCPNLLDPSANWHRDDATRTLEGTKFKLHDCHNNYLIGNKYRDISIFSLKFSSKKFVNSQNKVS